MAQINSPVRWDIFCTVVDNFGDIGVCWRLSRQLAAEHNIAVRLWVDDLKSFQRICPPILLQPQQWQLGVEVRHWHAEQDFSGIDVAAVVVEAFACELPPEYLQVMVQGVNSGAKAPVWLNLEYLTAESWAGDYHTLPSIEPKSGLCKYFFFPGFVSKTGGLLREAGLFSDRDAFQNSPEKREDFLRSLAVTCSDGALLISLFGYENEALPCLLDAMHSGAQAIHLLVPEGRMTLPVTEYLGEALTQGQSVTRGALTVQSLPFVAQSDYDKLLWCCDINMVRGEDSLIRAIWAGRPLLWHCYPQADKVHFLKLQALLGLYCQPMSPSAAALTTELWLAWNEGHGDRAQACWPDYLAHLHELFAYAKQWASSLGEQPDLARQMLQFYKKLI